MIWTHQHLHSDHAPRGLNERHTHAARSLRQTPTTPRTIFPSGSSLLLLLIRLPSLYARELVPFLYALLRGDPAIEFLSLQWQNMLLAASHKPLDQPTNGWTPLFLLFFIHFFTLQCNRFPIVIIILRKGQRGRKSDPDCARQRYYCRNFY